MDSRENPVRPPRVPTIKDVATLAGVSVGTVSNVLNSPDLVAPATRDRVVSAIERSGFIRNENARSLASGTVHTVALVIPDITNTVFVDMSEGAQAAASELGLNLVIANADGDPALQESYLDLFAQARSSGILLAPIRDSRAGVQRVRDHGRPVVMINYDDPELDVCTVLMDNFEGGRNAALHVVELGFRRIVFVGGPDVIQPIRERRRGVRAVAVELGIALEEIDLADIRFPGEGWRIGSDIAAGWVPGDEPLAVLVVTDSLAEGVLRAILTRTEIRVPEDVAVMGMDGNRMSWDAPITMTTLDLPGFAMGAEAIRMLVEERSPDHQHHRVVLPVGLRARESTMGRSPWAADPSVLVGHPRPRPHSIP